MLMFLQGATVVFIFYFSRLQHFDDLLLPKAFFGQVIIIMIVMSVKIHEISDKGWKGVMVFGGGFEEDYWLPAALWISASHPLNLVCVNSFGFPNPFPSQWCKASQFIWVSTSFFFTSCVKLLELDVFILSSLNSLYVSCLPTARALYL